MSKNPNDKLAIVGSGPSAELLKNYDIGGFDVACLNNAWAAVPFDNIGCWHHSTDFKVLGQRIPDELQWDELERRTRTWRRLNLMENIPFYFDTTEDKSTVFLDLMSAVMNTICFSDRWAAIWFFGCDLDYYGEKTHFFGTSTAMNPKTKALLQENCPEHSGVAADPLRFGKAWMASHINKIRDGAKEYEIDLVVPSGRGLLFSALS